MCTLTWQRDESGLEVYFNRDEKKDRPVADVPSVFFERGIRFLSPRDPLGGGTWMLVNEYGVVICLLNRWREQSVQKPTMSRGMLVWRLAGASSVAELGAILEREIQKEVFAPLTLIGLDRDGEKRWDWDGQNLSRNELQQPMTSSSYRFEEVREARCVKWAEGLALDEYHRSEKEECSAYSVRMLRDDAQTWSRSRVRVGEVVEWEYFAESLDFIEEATRSAVAL